MAERIRTFHGDQESLRALVFTIARRRLADLRRRGARRRTHPVAPEALAELASGSDPADLVVERSSADQAIAELAASLSPEQAEVVVLRVVAGLSVDQVAKLLGKRPGAVRVAQHRALRRLAADATRAERSPGGVTR